MLSLSISVVPAIKLATHVTAAYRFRRTVGSTKAGDLTSIISFCTQYRLIVNGYVQVTVLEPFARWAVSQSMDPKTPILIHHALGAIFKATAIQGGTITKDLMERCGWQGLFSYNQISQLSLSFQGNSIAEGDILVLCIRFASELLGEKNNVPEAADPSGLLARQESHAIAEANLLAHFGHYWRLRKKYRSYAYRIKPPRVGEG